MSNIKDFLNTTNYAEQENVFFYGDVVENASSVTWGEEEKARDKKNWSNWRTANYFFYKEHLGKIKEGVLLDVGAGWQHFIELTSKFEAYAIDALPNRGIDLVCDINNDLPLKSNSFDVVFLSNVLEHVHNPTGLLNEVRRILKPGGMMIGTVPFLMVSHQRPYDYFRYTDIGLEKIMHIVGFSEIEVEPLGSPYNVYNSIQHKFYGTIPVNLKTRIFKRIFRKFNYFYISFQKFIFGEIQQNPIFTEGYGFYAKKHSYDLSK